MPLAVTRFTDDWLEWIADCVMMQVNTQDILDYLVSRGFDKKAAQKKIAEVENHPYVMAGTKIARRMKRRDWLLKLYQTLWENAPCLQTIERRETISREEFYKHYHCMNRPIILTRMLEDWHILKTWTPEYFKTRYGEREVQVVHMDENLKKSHVVMPFAQYVDTVCAGESNQWYMTNSNTPYNENVIGDLYNEVDRLPELLNPEGENPNGWLLFGPKGTITDLHFDLSNALYCQIYGRKHFKIIAPHDLPYVYPYRNFLSLVDMENPDYQKHPLIKNAKIFEFTLEPGEMLFLPIGWWHYVEGWDVSISLSFNNFYSKEGYHQYFDLYGQHPRIDD